MTDETNAALLGWRVTQTIDGAHAHFADYPLLPGDLLIRTSDGTWMKEAPGLAIGGFTLTDEQVATLAEVVFTRAGLSYQIGGTVA